MSTLIFKFFEFEANLHLIAYFMSYGVAENSQGWFSNYTAGADSVLYQRNRYTILLLLLALLKQKLKNTLCFLTLEGWNNNVVGSLFSLGVFSYTLGCLADGPMPYTYVL